MANTYTQIYIQIVFAVQNRNASISASWKERLHKYITGIIQNQGHKLIAINTMPDHAHIFIGMKPDMALSDLVRDVKRDSGRFPTCLPAGRFSLAGRCRCEIHIEPGRTSPPENLPRRIRDDVEEICNSI